MCPYRHRGAGRRRVAARLDAVLVPLRGTARRGTEFDSSYKRGQPTTFAPNQVIKGWTEAMQLMGEGDKWELYIPSELAYGDSKRGQFITPGAVLVFTIEILEGEGRLEAEGCVEP